MRRSLCMQSCLGEWPSRYVCKSMGWGRGDVSRGPSSELRLQDPFPNIPFHSFIKAGDCGWRWHRLAPAVTLDSPLGFSNGSFESVLLYSQPASSWLSQMNLLIECRAECESVALNVRGVSGAK